MDVREKEGLSDLQVQRLSEYLAPAFTELRDSALQAPANGQPSSADATAAIASFLRRASNTSAGARLWRAYDARGFCDEFLPRQTPDGLPLPCVSKASARSPGASGSSPHRSSLPCWPCAG